MTADSPSNSEPFSDAEETLPPQELDANSQANLPSNVKRIGDYELLGEIARGGMGVVYRARQTSLNRIVAVKMLRFADFGIEAERSRFRIEAEAVATLVHPNIVPIYEVGEHEGQPFFSMRLIEGGSLLDAISRGNWPIDRKDTLQRAVDTMRRVSLAVYDAHQHGIIHRDLKPGNILLDQEGVPYVADFGLAKRLNQQEAMTQTGSIVGTPAYMSPEQASGKGVTTSSDIYSLGAILYHILSGKPPFQASTPVETLRQVLEAPTPPVSKWNRFVDRDLETICQKCLEKDPIRRYSSAMALSEDLKNWQEGKPIAARPIHPIERLYRWSKRNPLNVAVTLLSLLLLILMVGTLTLGYMSTNNAIDGYLSERYINRIANASIALREGNSADAELYMRAAGARHDEDDRAGWEWHYLQRKLPCEYELSQLQGALRLSNWSPDGKQLAVFEQGGFLPSYCELKIWQSTHPKPTDEMLMDLILTEFPSFQSKKNSARSNKSSTFWTSTAWTNSYFPSTLAWDPSGRYLGVLFHADEFQIWDTVERTLVSTIPWKISDQPSHLQWNHEGNRIAMVSPSGHVEIFDVSSNSTISAFEHLLDTKDNLVAKIGWSADDQSLAISESNQTCFIDLATKETIRKWPFAVVAWNMKGTRWISRDGIGDADSEKVLIKAKFDKESCWSPDDRWIAGIHSSQIHVVDSSNGASVQRYSLKKPTTPIWFPSSERILAGSQILRDIHWSPEDREIALAGKLSILKVARDGHRVATVETDSKTVTILDSNGANVLAFSQHESKVMAVDWSHDGRRIASLDQAGFVRIWDTTSGVESNRYEDLAALSTGASTSADWQIAWSPDDQLLAASARSTSVRVWDLANSSIRYQLESRNARSIGWLEKPLSLNIELLETSTIGPRQRGSQVLDYSPFHRMLCWDVSTNSNHVYTLEVNSSVSQPPKFWPNGDRVFTPQRFGGQYNSETMESADKIRLSSRLLHGENDIQAIELAASPNRLFSLSAQGSLNLDDVGRNATLLRLPKCSKNSLMSFGANMLWVADGTTLRIHDGTPTDRKSIRGVSYVAYNDFDPQIVISICSFLVFGPIAFLAYPGIRMRYSYRWMIATALMAISLVALRQFDVSKTLQGLRTIAPLNGDFFQVVLDLGVCLMGLGAALFVVESVRLASIGHWIVPIVGILSILIAPSLLMGYAFWPSLSQLESDPMRRIMPLALLVFEMSLFALGSGMVVVRFNAATNRNASLRFQRAPGWVRWGLLGNKSTVEAALSSTLQAVMGGGVVILGIWVNAFPWWLRILIISTGLILIFSSFLNWCAMVWVVRHGGWKAQLVSIKRDT